MPLNYGSWADVILDKTPTSVAKHDDSSPQEAIYAINLKGSVKSKASLSMAISKIPVTAVFLVKTPDVNYFSIIHHVSFIGSTHLVKLISFIFWLFSRF